MGPPTQALPAQKPEASDTAGTRSWRASIGQAGRYLGQSLRLMVGMPDYDAYLSHMERTHPDQAPMSYEAFFQERLEARYGSRTGKCC
ncbi:MAG: YbdD/YjiX family protein [Proteobacteria bacterium]|nr:YbdD/YjiX family protein [Pseudomonadota bacterium]